MAYDARTSPKSVELMSGKCRPQRVRMLKSRAFHTTTDGVESFAGWCHEARGGNGSSPPRASWRTARVAETCFRAGIRGSLGQATSSSTKRPECLGRPWGRWPRRTCLRWWGRTRHTHTHPHSTAPAIHWSIAGMSRGVNRCGYVALAISCEMPHDGSTLPSNTV